MDSWGTERESGGPSKDVLQSRLGDLAFIRQGEDTLALCCPFCQTTGKSADTKFHLSVSLSKRVFHCYRCNTSGKLADLFGGKLLFVPPAKQSLLDVLDEFVVRDPLVQEKFDLDLMSVPMFNESRAFDYLTGNRNLTKKTIQTYEIRIGIGDYRNRVVIPVRNLSEDCTYFVARSYDGSEPRYRNPKLPKQGVVFNANRINGAVSIVCEGVFSAIYAGLHASSYLDQMFPGRNINAYNCSTAIFGSFLNRNQARVIAGRCSRAYLCFDSDRYIGEACLVGKCRDDCKFEKCKAAKLLSSFGVQVKIVTLPEPDIGKNDPETLTQEQFINCLRYAKTYREKGMYVHA